MQSYKNVSRETLECFNAYHKLLLKWNEKINLVSPNSIKDFWTRHLDDCLQLMKFLQNYDINLIDIGSGAGLPGIILSIAGIKNVTLVESDTKKAAFLLQASQISTNKIVIANKRIENISCNADVLTARGFSSLENIFSLTQNINIKAKYLLLKGEKYAQEVIHARKKWDFEYIAHDSVTCKNSKILEITNLQKIT